LLGVVGLQSFGAGKANMSDGKTPVLIGTKGGDHVLIELKGKSHSGWLQADLSLRFGVLTGHYPVQFVHGELHRFGKAIEEIYSDQRCTAALKPLEPYLVLALTSDGHGAIHVSGEARQKPGSKVVLVFEMELNRQDLPMIANTLILADRAA
jgi:hypothetical protein